MVEQGVVFACDEYQELSTCGSLRVLQCGAGEVVAGKPGAWNSAYPTLREFPAEIPQPSDIREPSSERTNCTLSRDAESNSPGIPGGNPSTF